MQHIALNSHNQQARRQKMKREGEFCKEMKWGGVFCKKWTFLPQNETKLMLDLFFILHFTYLGVRTHPTNPPPLPNGLISD